MEINGFITNPIAINIAMSYRLSLLVDESLVELSHDLYSVIDSLFSTKESDIFFAMDESFLSKIKKSFANSKKVLMKKSQKSIDDYSRKVNSSIIGHAKSSVVNAVRSVTGLFKFKQRKESNYEQTDALTTELNNLIKSVHEELINDTENSVLRNISSNDYSKESAFSKITDNLKVKLYKLRRKAKSISDNLINTSFNTAVTETSKALGIKKFKWIYTYRSHTNREYHELVLKDQIFDLNNPPIIQLVPQIRGYPGQLPNCRCKMSLVIPIGESL